MIACRSLRTHRGNSRHFDAPLQDAPGRSKGIQIHAHGAGIEFTTSRSAILTHGYATDPNEEQEPAAQDGCHDLQAGQPSHPETRAADAEPPDAGLFDNSSDFIQQANDVDRFENWHTSLNPGLSPTMHRPVADNYCVGKR